MIQMLLQILILILLTACTAPHVENGPGDEQSQNWEPPDPNCDTYEQLSCPDPGDGITIRKSCTILEGCRGLEHLRIKSDVGLTVNAIEPAARTRRDNYVDWIRGQGVHDVLIADCEVTSNNTTSAVFIGAGSYRIEMHGLQVSGGGTAQIYYGAESSRITITDSYFLETGSRAAVVMDSTDWWIFNDNEVDGDIETYRNCGEDGRTRITTTSYGQFNRNKVRGKLTLGSREGNKWYCLKDYKKGGPGSSDSDLDHSRFNEGKGNEISNGIKEGKSAKGNKIKCL